MTHDINHPSTLITGGTGRLGRYLHQHLPNATAPTRNQLDITQRDEVRALLQATRPRTIIHTAAFTDVVRAEVEPLLAWSVNVEGTRNIVDFMPRDARLVFISSDYVFGGFVGGYVESDPVGPFLNQYAASKGVAELHALRHPHALVIRTSFRDGVWPHPQAFVDHFTSQDYSHVIFPEILHAVRHHHLIPHRVLHVAGERRSAFEVARVTRPNVKPVSVSQCRVRLPMDASLDSSLWRQLKRGFPNHDSITLNQGTHETTGMHLKRD